MNRLRNLVIASSWALALFWANTACAGMCAEHEDWIRKDEQFISQVKTAYQQGPLAILPLLHPNFAKRINLGYGYSLVDGGIGGGCVSIGAQIIYKDDKPVAYKLIPQLPLGEDALKPRYMAFYAGLFPFANGGVMPVYYNNEGAEKPLEGCTVQMNATPEIRAYMTPYSGTTYGTTGGIANFPLQNRAAYGSIERQLDRQAHAYLLCSKNPATRLTAVEYFYSERASREGPINPEIQARIESIFAETPQITTMSGCFVHAGNSRDLVMEYARGRPR